MEIVLEFSNLPLGRAVSNFTGQMMLAVDWPPVPRQRRSEIKEVRLYARNETRFSFVGVLVQTVLVVAKCGRDGLPMWQTG